MYHNPATKPFIRLLLPILVGGMVYLLVLLAFDTVNRVLEDFFNQELLVCIGMAYLVLEGNRLLALAFRKHFLDSGKFWIWSIVLILVGMGLTVSLITGLLFLYFWQVEGMYSLESFGTELRVFNGVFLFVAFLYHSYFVGLFWLQLKLDQKIEYENYQSSLLDQNIHFFHYVLHPDFLLLGFENILLKLKEEKREAADEGILLLSGIYQYFLNQRQELLSIQNEIAVVRKIEDFLCRYSPYHIHLDFSIQNESYLLIPGTLVRIVESISSSQISSKDTPVSISIQQQSGKLMLSFQPNFSLTRKSKLFHMLEQVGRQHEWLGNNFHWENAGKFRIYVPIWKMEEMKEPKPNLSKLNINLGTYSAQSQ
ncbi:hypothetical protein [Litoribacter populi]|uniref:hypothetical protein n=1 Tax=Litoribacter populi TaxID=2598460 RepID=UPI00117C5600|nr:hypothetical protein [Litoribacter populi]